MRPLRYLPLLVLFGGFLLLGLSIGRQLEARSARSEKRTKPGLAQVHRSASIPKSFQERVVIETQPDQHSPSRPLSTPTQPATKPTRVYVEGNQPVQQNNILLIGVDDLDTPAPRLEGAWLVLYFAQTPHFTLVQIYPGQPSGQEGAGSPDADLATLFQADQQGAPGPGFFTELKARGLWWSGYIMVDRPALAETIDLIVSLSGADKDPALSPGSGAVARVPFAWHDPQGAYRSQTELIQKLCMAASQLNANHIGKLEDLFLLFGTHIISDMGRERLAAEMVGMLVHENRMTCELPFLTVDDP